MLLRTTQVQLRTAPACLNGYWAFFIVAALRRYRAVSSVWRRAKVRRLDLRSCGWVFSFCLFL